MPYINKLDRLKKQILDKHFQGTVFKTNLISEKSIFAAMEEYASKILSDFKQTNKPGALPDSIKN